MAKSKKGDGMTVSIGGGPKISMDDFKNKILGAAGRDYSIKDAAMKDQVCNYSYEVLSGNGIGDIHAVKGTGICLDDLIFAFGKLNVHLAAIDDIFKHSGVEIEDINEFHSHELASLYYVTGLKITGDQEFVILKGSKYVSSAGGRIDITTPKIAIDGMSSYQWYAELSRAVIDVQNEVSLYKEGKHEIPEETVKANPKQLSLIDAANKENEQGSGDLDPDFESAKV